MIWKIFLDTLPLPISSKHIWRKINTLPRGKFVRFLTLSSMESNLLELVTRFSLTRWLSAKFSTGHKWKESNSLFYVVNIKTSEIYKYRYEFICLFLYTESGDMYICTHNMIIRKNVKKWSLNREWKNLSRKRKQDKRWSWVLCRGW